MKPYNPMLIQSPSQTVGPYFAQGLLREGDSVFTNVLTSEKTEGERIRIEGRVTDGDGQPIEDAMIEIWQATSRGRYHHPLDEQDKPLDPEFKGHGRTATDTDGNYWFETIKPGSVPGPKSSCLRAECCRMPSPGFTLETKPPTIAIPS